MKFSINKEEFLAKIILSSRFTSSKLSSSTSLQGVFLKKEKDKIHFYSTNLNLYYHGFMKLVEKGDFITVIEPKKISEFLSLLPQGNVEVDVREKSIVLIQGKTKGEFPVFSSSDFPILKESKSEKQKISTDFFKNILPLISFSASTDETRPVLTGVNFVSADGSTQLVTTDGFRLSLYSFKENISISSVIVPTSFLIEVGRLIGGEKEVVFNIDNEEKILTFFLKEDELSTRLIEGEYPPYEKVIPSERKTTILVDKDEFLRNIKIVSVFARDLSNIVVLDTDDNGIKISPKAGNNEENTTYQDAKIEGEKQKIAFNYRFLVDLLSSIPAKKVIIELLRSDAPAVFKGEKDGSFLHIIMPVRVQE
ncbi:DNA polymerase III subunit beta [Microgenomates bacterium UTCPR1]|nr:DNA polymerase III subunit beta [Patescibacteria group bacterium]OQY67884.1 MAG: DNA polymerase III subunit beta [Microgenomates bacterium UTCPR1]